MTVHYATPHATLHHGDCLEVLRELPDNSVDSIVTDPPAGIGFMGKAWDGAKGGREQWSAWLAEVMAECLRVAKPGAHALVWALPRTSHWTACGLEDSGWVIRDRIAHLFGSGFPKSHDVSKAIDRMAGKTRNVIGIRNPRCSFYPAACAGHGDAGRSQSGMTYHRDKTNAATDAARQWEGWGTALKPSAEDWWLARKPLEGTVAQNVLQYGTGALNIDGCRVRTDDSLGRTNHVTSKFVDNANGTRETHARTVTLDNSAGKDRWPPNTVFTHSPDCGDRCAPHCPCAVLDQQSGERTSGAWDGKRNREKFSGAYGRFEGQVESARTGDSGGASRFFPQFRPDPFLYMAKAASAERVRSADVAHPTVKPLDLMRWLVRLVTPPDGVVLDPFAGSGTTGEAALMEGVRCVLIERESDYLPLIFQRLTRQRDPIAHAKATGTEGDGLW